MRTRSAALCAAALVLSHSPGYAASSFPSHRGTSPWNFASVTEPSSTYVVNDTDSSTIDVYLYRPGGPIIIDVYIRRYLGPTNADGKLLNVNDLIARGIVSETATITLPTYDVDEATPPNYDCDGDGTVDMLASEVDTLSVNDDEIGTLKGSNNVWSQNSFTVPISMLRFPSEPGRTGVNRFRLDIDVANEDVVLSSGKVGCERWAVTIDWIGVKFEASSPVIMVHGIDSGGWAFGDFKAGLESALIMANDNSIVLTDAAPPDSLSPACEHSAYNDSIKANVAQLRSLVPAIAQRLGAETLHFVAHSKGGLDVRGFLYGLTKQPIVVQVGTMGGQPVERELVGQSLVTLNTPHSGSVLAAFGVQGRQLSFAQKLRAGYEFVVASKFEGPYYCDLTPARASAFIAETALPAGTRAASVATDADCDGSFVIDSERPCPSGAMEAAKFTGGAPVADTLYQLVGTVADVEVTVKRRKYLPDEIDVERIEAETFQYNDVVVTRGSAALYPEYYSIDGWNHLNVHSRANAIAIATDAQGGGGLVDWRLR